MARFLAIYNGAASDPAKGDLSQEEQAAFMSAWATWAQTHQSALVDPGAPLFTKKRVTSDGVEDFTDAKVGYAIVEAVSHEHAVRIFAQHPHLSLMTGNSIDVIECPPVPGQTA